MSYSPGHVPGAYGYRGSGRKEKPTTTRKDHAAEIHRLQKKTEARRKEVAFRCCLMEGSSIKLKISSCPVRRRRKKLFQFALSTRSVARFVFNSFVCRRSSEALSVSMYFLRATPSSRTRLCGSSTHAHAVKRRLAPPITEGGVCNFKQTPHRRQACLLKPWIASNYLRRLYVRARF